VPNDDKAAIIDEQLASVAEQAELNITYLVLMSMSGVLSAMALSRNPVAALGGLALFVINAALIIVMGVRTLFLIRPGQNR
jgi:hypothetical protein